jgi:uncharacterized protein (DUF1015 family)
MKIIPFSGYRYNSSVVSSLDDLISPPYDQFKEGLDDRLYKRHPCNIARIIMNKETSSDSEQDNRYIRSRALLDQWIGSGIFLQDQVPSFYPYFQKYQVGGEERCRKGFIALGEVTDYSERMVLPHERTLAKPKQDRLDLLRATLADTGLVFMLYSDPVGEIEKLLDPATSITPLMSALDLNEEVNQLWRITDPALSGRIQEIMSNKSVIIADGHHRYEVAQMFKEEIKPRIHQDPRWEKYQYKIMSFVRLESAGITIFPIHRVVHSLKSFSATTLIERLKQSFVVEEYFINPDNQFSTLDFLMTLSLKQQQAGGNALVVYLPSLRRFILLKLRVGGSDLVQWPVDKSRTWRKLDVSILQVMILGELLGITDQQLTDQSHLEYISHHEEAVRMVDEKGYQCAFLLNPTPVEMVKAVVEAGDVLPQKSTHFHPKLMEGLVFAKHI